jgi:hypothetical protein
MATDLVRHKERWAAGVKELRAVFARLEAEGYTAESQTASHICAVGCGWAIVSGGCKLFVAGLGCAAGWLRDDSRLL